MMETENAFFEQGKRQGLIGGALVGICLGVAATSYYCYEKYGPPAQVPNLSLLMGDLRRAKDDCEGIVYSTKNRWSAHIITDSDVRVGASAYRDLASRFNGISTTLEAMISTGYDEKSLEEVKTNLTITQSQYHAFRVWFDRLPVEKPKLSPRGAEQPNGQVVIGDARFQALPEIAVDLAKHFFDGMKEMDKLKKEHLIGMLHEVRFTQWSEIPAR